MPEAKNAIILISPHVPARSGHGASMRIGAHLEILSRHYQVHLHLVTENSASNLDREFISAHTVSVNVWKKISTRAPNSLWDCLVEAPNLIPRLVREYPLELVDQIAKTIPKDMHFSRIHVFRLALAKVGEKLACKLGVPLNRVVVDMDDYESESAQRALSLNKNNLGRILTASAFFDLLKLKRFERYAADYFGGLFLCSEIDRNKFIGKHPSARVNIVPNGYRIPEKMLPQSRELPKRILFVGSLNYQPNIDAIEYFVQNVWLPHLQSSGFELVVAGRQAPKNIRKLCAEQRILLIADPPEIEPVYQSAALLIVPLRTGGGTRIKILESFGFGRPVVSTTIGAEGLDVQDGVHLLLADDARSFADACLKVLNEPGIADALTKSARSLVQTKYSLPMIESAISAGYDGFDT